MVPADKNELPHLVVVSGYPPNRNFGGGIILFNLLCEYPPEKLAVITSAGVLANEIGQKNDGDLLPVRHILVHPWRSGIPGLRRVLRTLNVVKLVSTTKTILRQLSQNTAILAVPWGGEFGSELFASAYLAHKLSGAPLILYELDEWRASLGRYAGRVARFLERIFHGRMVNEAHTLWVISDALAAEFSNRFNVHARVMPNAVDVDRYSAGRHGERANRNEFRLVYTGSIYGAQADAIRNVLEAVQSEPQSGYSLVVYTNQSAAQLAAIGIEGESLLVEKTVPLDCMPQVLGTADGLLLPLSFLPEQRAIVSTSLPAKTADYLASGVPILVHSPSYATVAKYASMHGWGELVEVPNRERILAALRRLAGDTSRREHLVAQALKTAYARHNLSTLRAEFNSSIQQALPRQSVK